MELAYKLVKALFPSRCLLCQKTIHDPAAGQGSVLDIDICASCFQGLPFNLRHCSCCALPLAEDLPHDVICGRCIKEPPAFDYCCSLYRYEEAIIKLVHRLKFSDSLTSARTIGALLASASGRLISEFGRPDCLMPVPLHSRRLRSRGYNQSIEIARETARKQSISIDRFSLIRQRSTSTQTGLDAKSRLKNIKGAFRVNREIGYKHVLIVDDVVTTGATVNELARLLKRSGVQTVGVLSFARAPIKN